MMYFIDLLFLFSSKAYRGYLNFVVFTKVYLLGIKVVELLPGDGVGSPVLGISGRHDHTSVREDTSISEIV